MVNGVSMVVSDGEWCFNGRVCMVNGVSMVMYDGEWCFNGGVHGDSW